MAETQNRHTNGSSGVPQLKKRKSFWSNIFGRSSKSGHVNEKDEHEPKHKRFMDSLVTNARQAATKEVMHLAEKEAMKEVDSHLNNNNSNSNNNTTTDNSGTDPSTTDNDPLNAASNWAKRMVNNAQQKVQSLQSSMGS